MPGDLISHEQAINIFENAGWFPGRRVDVGGAIKQIQRRGFIASAPVEAFLSEFDGLVLKRFMYHRQPVVIESQISPLAAMKYYDDESAAVDRRKIGVPVCPVGRLFDGVYVLLSDPELNFYASDEDNEVFLIGSGVGDLIDRCFDGNKWKML